MFELMLLTLVAVAVSIILLIGFVVVTLAHSLWTRRFVILKHLRKFWRAHG